MAAQPSPVPSDRAPDAGTAAPAFSPLYQQIKELLTRSLQTGESEGAGGRPHPKLQARRWPWDLRRPTPTVHEP